MNERISFKSRGIGSDWYPCYICEIDQLNHNIAAFVESKESGEEVQKWLNVKSLDYRDFEPNWIQIKIGACEMHLTNLEKLERLCSDGFITKERIDASKQISFSELKQRFNQCLVRLKEAILMWLDSNYMGYHIPMDEVSKYYITPTLVALSQLLNEKLSEATSNAPRKSIVAKRSLLLKDDNPSYYELDSMMSMQELWEKVLMINEIEFDKNISHLSNQIDSNSKECYPELKEKYRFIYRMICFILKEIKIRKLYDGSHLNDYKELFCKCGKGHLEIEEERYARCKVCHEEYWMHGTWKKRETCLTCNGRGSNREQGFYCRACSGSGTYWHIYMDDKENASAKREVEENE